MSRRGDYLSEIQFPERVSIRTPRRERFTEDIFIRSRSLEGFSPGPLAGNGLLRTLSSGVGLLKGFSPGPLAGNGLLRRLSTGKTIPVTGFGLLRGFTIQSSTLMTKEDTTLFEVNIHAKPIQPPPMPGTRHRTTMREVWEGKPGKESFLNAGGCRHHRQ